MLTPLFLILEFLICCLTAVLLGGLIGLEREYHRKAAGIKTHVLICLGATAFTYLSYHVFAVGDPGRIAAQVVSGIGFIGAGTIMQSKKVIQGLTTAASLWVVAAIGMLIGTGFWIPALTLTLITTIFLITAKKMTGYRSKKKHYTLSIDILNIKTLEKINLLIETFELIIDHKSLQKNHLLHLQINYYATTLTQHLFLKKLFSLKGIGEIIKM